NAEEEARNDHRVRDGFLRSRRSSRATCRRAGAQALGGAAARMALRTGVPVEEIIRAATEESADMIVMGTHGRTGLAGAVLGSVAAQVIRSAPCPVLTVGPGATPKR